MTHDEAAAELEAVYLELVRLHDKAVELEAILGGNRGAMRSRVVRRAKAEIKAAKIRALYERLGRARGASKLIQAELGVSRATVTRALKAGNAS